MILAKNRHLIEDYFTSSFISGLKEELRLHVLMLAPNTFSRAIILARMQEPLLDIVSKRMSTSKPPPVQVPTYTPIKDFTSPITSSRLFSMTNFLSTSNSIPKIPHIKKLTFAEMRAIREKGLCNNCDQVFQKGHKCVRKQLCMLSAEDEDSSSLDDTSPMDSPFRQEVEEEVEISVHAISGNVSHSTIKVRGEVKNTSFFIIIDSGSTHSFLDPQAAKRCGSYIQPTTALLVVVADGNKLVSEARCPSFQ